MSVTKDGNTDRWMSQVRVTDWTSKIIHKKKRGFQPSEKPCNGNVNFSVKRRQALA